MLVGTLLASILSLFNIHLIAAEDNSVVRVDHSQQRSRMPEIHRVKRFVARKKRWKKNHLTWHLESGNINSGDQFLIRNTLHRAFNLWEGVSSVRFEEREDESETDISISFERGSHMDAYPFDGQDGVVAHAFYPRDGRLHFDADEEWTLNSSNGVNLYQTAVHEIGHLLGLEHSENSDAVMLGAKRPYNPKFNLAEDDVKGVQVLFPLAEEHFNEDNDNIEKNHPSENPSIVQIVDNLSMEHTKPTENYRKQFPYPLPIDLSFKRTFIF